MPSKSANPVLGLCVCPLCHEPGAEVRQGTKGRLYIVCDGCASNIYTMSRQGRALIANLLDKESTQVSTEQTKATATDPAPQPAPAAVAPSPPPAKPKRATVPSFFGLQP